MVVRAATGLGSRIMIGDDAGCPNSSVCPGVAGPKARNPVLPARQPEDRP